MLFPAPPLVCPPAGAETCQECAPGTLPNSNKTACELCPVGTYSALPGVSSCTTCPAGTFRGADGGDGTECTPCPPGSWSASGAGECTLCEAGWANELWGQTACKPW